ncbi:hypothetical protein AYO21_00101 [Fonsecaea monophora]|uniref:Uncharacterized protein n=1 Tax=Fonsecaea monophora TaxID=254056 RepID=A0A177FMM1_9EURO|nr:hypothetical protein AYO21_00101 [Fonsecaea monophora]OAG45467.1 hypothetical protein AYO21_00101 [Fonsecaea monophora]
MARQRQHNAAHDPSSIPFVCLESTRITTALEDAPKMYRLNGSAPQNRSTCVPASTGEVGHGPKQSNQARVQAMRMSMLVALEAEALPSPTRSTSMAEVDLTAGVWQPTAGAHHPTDSSPEPAAFRFWREIRARPETLELFLGHVFALKPTPGDVVRPFYRQGKLAGYIRTGSADMVEQDNVDLRAMRVSREFRDVGSRLVYGRYTFCFDDAQNCRWWTKHIGRQNFANLRAVSVRVESGWTVPCDDICSVDLCFEEQWQRFFTWMRYRHRMDALVLDFSPWRPVPTYRELSDERRAEVTEWRDSLLATLSELRGFTVVKIVDRYEVAIPAADKDEWCATMTEAREPPPPPPPVDTPSMPLGQILKRLREMRRQQEYRERLDRREQKQKRKEKKQQKRFLRQSQADEYSS